MQDLSSLLHYLVHSYCIIPVSLKGVRWWGYVSAVLKKNGVETCSHWHVDGIWEGPQVALNKKCSLISYWHEVNVCMFPICMYGSHSTAWTGSSYGFVPLPHMFLMVCTPVSGESVFLCCVDTSSSWMWIIRNVNLTFGELVIQGQTSSLEYSPNKHTESKT